MEPYGVLRSPVAHEQGVLKLHEDSQSIGAHQQQPTKKTNLQAGHQPHRLDVSFSSSNTKLTQARGSIGYEHLNRAGAEDDNCSNCARNNAQGLEDVLGSPGRCRTSRGNESSPPANQVTGLLLQ